MEEGPQRIPYCGGVKSAHWAEVQQDVLEAGGGSHTADPVAPRLCEGEEDEDEGVVSVGPSANQLTLEVVSPAFHFLERDYRNIQIKSLKCLPNRSVIHVQPQVLTHY